MDVIKRGAVVPVSRELLLEAGAVEPTIAEHAEMERQRIEGERRAAERAVQLAVFRDALASVVFPLARAMLDLHAEDEHGRCGGCDFDGMEGEPPEWPCRTVVTVARHYGIDMG